ncbi:LIC12077 family protein [Leptospira borgpetersenii]|uniref:Uncharacterized protein n=1 Tax=Leptospira borgpetersenii serovar Pomona str. 200901868 TaxID=1192866 RepID=M6VSR7_LEPBO|nr:hypothetical protein [Leptospira borgpetersenii]EMO60512.1 hypothetical protein LEP1GSC133_0301 [Leptospira borgpetersenii serovar Pomona str. 200901868]
MVLVRKTENEIDRQLRYFLEEKLEGILEEAQKTRKRRQELFGTKKNQKDGADPEDADCSRKEIQLTFWDEDPCEHNKRMDSPGTGS